MGVVIRCAAAYTGVCPDGTESESSSRNNPANQNSGHKTLSEYVEEIKTKNLVDVNDYSVGKLIAPDCYNLNV